MKSAIPFKFESLGDNCEFGFVQRMNLIENGGLLRWAISFPEPLISNIANGFDDLYRFESLTPHSPTMVSDNGTYLKFHSKLTSSDGRFTDDEVTRREIHQAEREKLVYLRDKLLRLLAGAQKHFIYKHNMGTSREQAQRLAAAIAVHGPASVLVVNKSDEGAKLLTVEQVGANLYLGYLPDFAKYATANQFDMIAWLKLLGNAELVMPELQP